MTMMSDDWKSIFESFPPRVTRKQIEVATGGLVHGRTLANRDCIGTGIPGKKIIAKKATYAKSDAIAWILAYCGENGDDAA